MTIHDCTLHYDYRPGLAVARWSWST